MTNVHQARARARAESPGADSAGRPPIGPHVYLGPAQILGAGPGMKPTGHQDRV